MSLFSLLHKVFPRSFRKDPDNFVKLQEKLGYFFKDTSLLKQALTHRSSLQQGETSNERLEFLGDSILGLLISFFLYKNFPDKSEGELTKLKATLVSEPSLNLVASSIGLGRYIFLSAEAEKSGGREKASIISDAFEAIVGAIFLDGGLTQAKKVVQDQVFSRFSELTDESIFYNYKGELLEYLQARELSLPRYEVMEEEGPDHQKIFTIAVVIKGKKMGVGKGTSKKDAEQSAAKEALEKIKENSSNQNLKIEDPDR